MREMEGYSIKVRNKLRRRNMIMRGRREGGAIRVEHIPSGRVETLIT